MQEGKRPRSLIQITILFFCKVGNVPKDNLGYHMVVNPRMELCGAFINYTVKGKAKDKKKGG